MEEEIDNLKSSNETISHSLSSLTRRTRFTGPSSVSQLRSSSPPPPTPPLQPFFKNPKFILKLCFLVMMYLSLTLLWLSHKLRNFDFPQKFMNHESNLTETFIACLYSMFLYPIFVILVLNYFELSLNYKWVLNFKLLRILVDAGCVLLFWYKVGPEYQTSDFWYLEILGAQCFVDSTLGFYGKNGFVDLLVIASSGFLNFSYFLQHWKQDKVLIISAALYGLLVLICLVYANIYPDYATGQLNQLSFIVEEPDA